MQMPSRDPARQNLHGVGVGGQESLVLTSSPSDSDPHKAQKSVIFLESLPIAEVQLGLDLENS